MGNEKLPVASPKTDAFSLIQRFMAGGQDLELTADAERMLKRLMFADTLFRSNKKTSDEICKDLQQTFQVSEFTALKDIKNAQKLFATVRNINKTYLTHLHLERINQDIELLRERLFWMEDDDLPGVKRARVPDAKELAALARLEQVYTNAIEAAPIEKQKDSTPPPVFQFVLVKGAEIKTGMTVDDALTAADKLLAQGSTVDDAQDIEYEETGPDDDGPDPDDLDDNDN